MVYDTVVKDTLDEVMMGYNCTIFAYGQTGTGKTYTMQGDLTPTILGAPSSEAGIVPRTLHRLFSLLEASRSEYSVKISFVELYNEEIRDLLVADASTHNAAPGATSFGGVGSAGAIPGGLKIYDDPNPRGRGVVIQGLEECLVKDAKDGIMQLRKGSARRETGETLMNKFSSRSHSIFSITVHLKESSPTGEDLLKVGKFNLVDLAGSENIGRSGAEDMRAREAGMINQSLLTLGRVINALVDRGKHVPYRESKLTRLLQDSLGGKTKTRLIATISPSRSNLEETLSTIDYATRATRIQNKPEINQRMTKGALIKEYVMEIERLKADLLASREKNGVFLSQESWADLASENELRKTQTEEAKSRQIILETRLAGLKTELEDHLKIFLATESELKLTKEEVVAKVEELVRKEQELEGVKEELEVEKVVSEVFEKGEKRLDGVAGGLRRLAKESLGDLEGVFSKLGRKTDVMVANSSVISSYGSSTAQATIDLASRLEEFQQTQEQLGQGLMGSVELFRTRNAEKLTSQLAILDEHLASINAGSAALGTIMDGSIEERSAFVSVVNQARSAIHASLGTWARGFKVEMGTTTDALMVKADERLEAVSRPLNEAVSSLDSMVVDVRDHVQAQKLSLNANTDLLASAVDEEIQRLSDSDTSIASLIDSQKAALLDFQARISSVVADFTTTQTQQLVSARSQAQAQRQLSENRIRAMQVAHQQTSSKAIENGVNLSSRLDELESRVARISESGSQAITVASTDLRTGLASISEVATASLDVEMADIEQHFVEMAQASEKSSSRATKSHKKFKSALHSLASGSQASHSNSRQGLEEVRLDVEQTTSQISSSYASTSSNLQSFHSTSFTALSNLRDSTHTFLNSVAEDVPTGSTPRKRTWDVQEHWERSGSRSDVVEKYQRVKLQGGSMMGELQEDVDDDLARSVGSSSQASTLGEQPQQLVDGYQKARNGGGGMSASSSRGSSPSTEEFVQLAAPAPPPPTTTLVVPQQPPTLKSSASSASLSSSMKMPSGKGGLKSSKAAGGGEGRERAPSGEALIESRTNIPRTGGGTIGRGDGRRRG
ncbi:P-loop containing nucleoside triphosphate hydrolase protein [Mrakia frigida]|uniref:P-loop containing nucleoside triphosphate hydrolase protein n=1 Tax=Mrakia frigida TaxID=29902 RepID=UPI003FCC1B50